MVGLTFTCAFCGTSVKRLDYLSDHVATYHPEALPAVLNSKWPGKLMRGRFEAVNG